jgi:hypothetical protein
LPEQSVEAYSEVSLKLVQIHDQDALPGPHVVHEQQVHRQTDGFAGHAGPVPDVLGAPQLQSHPAIAPFADDGAVGASVQHQFNRLSIDFSFDKNQGSNIVEGQTENYGIGAVRKRPKQKQEQNQGTIRVHGTKNPRRADRASSASRGGLDGAWLHSCSHCPGFESMIARAMRQID